MGIGLDVELGRSHPGDRHDVEGIHPPGDAPGVLGVPLLQDDHRLIRADFLGADARHGPGASAADDQHVGVDDWIVFFVRHMLFFPRFGCWPAARPSNCDEYFAEPMLN